MTLTLLLLLAQTSNEELLATLLTDDGTKASAAARAIVDRGPAMIGVILRDGKEWRSHRRSDRVRDVLFELRRKLAPDESLFERMASTRITLRIKDGLLDRVLDCVRERAGVNIQVDPVLQAEEARVTIELEKGSLRCAIEQITVERGWEYDVRYGVIFISTEERLWSKAPAAQVACEDVKRLSAEALDERERAADALQRLGTSAIPWLETGFASDDREVRAGCRQLMDELNSADRVHGRLPRGNQWQLKDEAKGRAALTRKLHEKMDVNLDFNPAEIIATLLDEYIGPRAAKGVKLPDRVSLRLKDVEFWKALALMTLPYGLDVRIEGGKPVIFSAPK